VLIQEKTVFGAMRRTVKKDCPFLARDEMPAVKIRGVEL